MSVFGNSAFKNHELVAFKCDKKAGLKAIIAIHNTNLGPALGGCRIFPYGSEEDALVDVLRLSRSMSYKSALAGLPLGGGKAVIIADPRRDKTPALLWAMGDFVESLAGKFIVAEDSGTTVEDIRLMAERTAHISGMVGAKHGGDPSPTTGYGVFIGLVEAVKHKLGKSSLKGVKVAIQGCGNVGYNLAERLLETGAIVYAADVSSHAIGRAVEELGVIAVEPQNIFTLDVDVFSPCAMGAVLNDKTIAALRASIVAGSANNQLAEARHADDLREKGILYAPDFVINVGGLIDAYYQRTGATYQQLKDHVDRVGQTLGTIFERATKESRNTSEIAEELAEERFLAVSGEPLAQQYC